MLKPRQCKVSVLAAVTLCCQMKFPSVGICIFIFPWTSLNTYGFSTSMLLLLHVLYFFRQYLFEALQRNCIGTDLELNKFETCWSKLEQRKETAAVQNTWSSEHSNAKSVLWMLLKLCRHIVGGTNWKWSSIWQIFFNMCRHVVRVKI